jgi:hypothetical protein
MWKKRGIKKAVFLILSLSRNVGRKTIYNIEREINKKKKILQ